MDARGRRAVGGGSGTTRCSSIATRCGPSSTRPPTSPACGSGASARWSTRRDSPGVCVERRWISACACTSGPRSPDSTKTTSGVALDTPGGRVDARRVVLATNAFPPLVRSIRRYVVPVYDYVLMTEPLTADQLASIGWVRRQGFADSANHFHYYRMSADDRILWGGYDAVYHWRNAVAPRARTTRGDVLQARRPLLRDVPATRRCAVLAPLGWRDRHVQSLLGDVRHGPRRPRRVRRRVHGHGGRGHAVRRPHGARPGRRARHRTHQAAARAFQAGAVPPRTPAIRGHRTDRPAPSRRPTGYAGRRGLWLRMLDAVGLGFDS